MLELTLGPLLCDKWRGSCPTVTHASYLVPRQQKLQSDMSLCRSEGCTTFGTYGYPDNATRWCKRHSNEHMINKTIRMCGYPGCTKKATYGNGTTLQQVRCAIHRQPWQVNVVSRRCDTEGCTTQPSYGQRGKRRRCSKHALPEDTHWKTGKKSIVYRTATEYSQDRPKRRTSRRNDSITSEAPVTTIEQSSCLTHSSQSISEEVPLLHSSSDSITYDPFDLVEYPWVRTCATLCEDVR